MHPDEIELCEAYQQSTGRMIDRVMMTPIVPPKTRRNIQVEAEICPPIPEITITVEPPTPPPEVEVTPTAPRLDELQPICVDEPAKVEVHTATLIYRPTTTKKRAHLSSEWEALDDAEEALVEAEDLTLQMVDAMAEARVDQQTLLFLRSETTDLKTKYIRARLALRALKRRTRGETGDAETQCSTSTADAHTQTDCDNLAEEIKKEEPVEPSKVKRAWAKLAFDEISVKLQPEAPFEVEEDQTNPRFFPSLAQNDKVLEHYDIEVERNLLAFLRMEACFRDRTGEAGARLALLLKRKAIRFLKSDYDVRHLTYPILCKLVTHAVGVAMIPAEDEERVRRLLTNPEITRMRETHGYFTRDLTSKNHGLYCKLRSAIKREIGPWPDFIKVLYATQVA